MELTEDILYGFLKMRQPETGPRVNMDTVLLAGFTRVRDGENVIELGCAHGAVTLILAKRRPNARYTGIDIQPHLIVMACDNAEFNGLSGNTSFLAADLRNVRSLFTHQTFDVLTVNPPYEDPGNGVRSVHGTNRTARQGQDCTLEDVCAAAHFLLKNKGRLYIVMRALRLAETLALLHKYRIGPRMLTMVHPTPDKNASVFLLEAIRNGGSAMTVRPPLYVYGSDGNYTAELMEYYAETAPAERRREKDALQKEAETCR